MEMERLIPLLSSKSTKGLRIRAISRQKIKVMNILVKRAANTEIISNGIRSIKNLFNPDSGLFMLDGI